MPRQHLSSALILALLAALLAGCPRGNAKLLEATRAGAFHVGNGAEPQDIDPQTVTGVPEHKICMALFEGLVTEDPRDLHPLPGVAKSWEISTDGRVYTFHLRDDAKWSNGDALTADDFIQSYKRMLTPALGSEYSYLLWFVVGAEEYQHSVRYTFADPADRPAGFVDLDPQRIAALEGAPEKLFAYVRDVYDADRKYLEDPAVAATMTAHGPSFDFSLVGFAAPDPLTLRVTLKHPTPFLLGMIASHYSWYPVPLKVIATFGGLERKGTAWTRPENFVGNGPFVLTSWQPQREIVVSRNPTYWDRANVKLNEIHFHPTENIASEENMFRAGQLHMTNDLPNAKIDVYRAKNPEALRIDPYLGIYFYRFNVKRPPFDDKRVRRALALAIDRESIVKNITRGGQRPAYAVSYPGTAGYTPQARLTGTLDDARRLLAEAGYPGGRGFPEVSLLYNTSENHRSIAEAIQQMWRENLGVEIALVNQEWKVYLDNQHTHNFDIERAGWIADYVDPHVFLEIWVGGNTNNDTNWSNAEYDRLCAAALAARDDAERYAIYQKMDAILVDELPILPIYFYTRVHAISPMVKGYHPTLLDNHPYKYVWLEPPK